MSTSAAMMVVAALCTPGTPAQTPGVIDHVKYERLHSPMLAKLMPYLVAYRTTTAIKYKWGHEDRLYRLVGDSPPYAPGTKIHFNPQGCVDLIAG